MPRRRRSRGSRRLTPTEPSWRWARAQDGAASVVHLLMTMLRQMFGQDGDRNLLLSRDRLVNIGGLRDLSGDSHQAETAALPEREHSPGYAAVRSAPNERCSYVLSRA